MRSSIQGAALGLLPPRHRRAALRGIAGGSHWLRLPQVHRLRRLGALEKDLGLGHLVVVSAALRDEGTSYHYLPAGREVTAHPRGVAALEAALTRQGVPYRVGKTWTTDAPYRETREKIARRLARAVLRWRWKPPA